MCLLQVMNTVVEYCLLGTPKSYAEPFFYYDGSPDYAQDEQGNLVEYRKDGDEVT